MQTSVEGVFAAGEIAARTSASFTSAGMGAAAAISATHYWRLNKLNFQGVGGGDPLPTQLKTRKALIAPASS